MRWTPRAVRKCECGDHAWHVLTKGFVGLISVEDAEYVGKYSWTTRPERAGYLQAMRKHGGKRLLLHRDLLNAPADKVVDHINGNTLDNRRGNLRLCSNQQNSRNQRPRRGTSSRFKGVTWDSSVMKWRAQIRANERTKHLGAFDEEQSAAEAYDAAAQEFFGEFARLNFPAFTHPKDAGPAPAFLIREQTGRGA